MPTAAATFVNASTQRRIDAAVTARASAFRRHPNPPPLCGGGSLVPSLCGGGTLVPSPACGGGLGRGRTGRPPLIARLHRQPPDVVPFLRILHFSFQFSRTVRHEIEAECRVLGDREIEVGIEDL